jgi:hypothetical protein
VPADDNSLVDPVWGCVVTRRERDRRNEAIVAAYRRGVPVIKLASTHGLTRQAIHKIVRGWDDLPSIPRDGVRVDANREVARTLAAFEQAIADLGEIVAGTDTQAHVKLGAIGRALDAHERRLKLMASAGYISRNLAAPLVEQEMAAMTQAVADLMRRHNVSDEVIGELVTMAKQRVRGPAAVIEAEAVAG